MNIQITREIFEGVVAAAVTPTTEIFDRLAHYFELAEQELTDQLLGVSAHLAEEPGRLHAAVTDYICLRAFDLAMPHLDLVLTPTGFGVVSNQNLAPASAERVRQLRQEVRLSVDRAYDHALHALLGTEWADTPLARKNVPGLIFDGQTLRTYIGGIAKTRTELQDPDLAIGLTLAYHRLDQIISYDLGEFLLTQIRKAALTPVEQQLVVLCSRFVGAYIQHRNENQPYPQGLEDQISAYLERYLTDFPLYEQSSVYKAKTTPKYENKKDDPCFFFG